MFRDLALTFRFASAGKVLEANCAPDTPLGSVVRRLAEQWSLPPENDDLSYRVTCPRRSLTLGQSSTPEQAGVRTGDVLDISFGCRHDGPILSRRRDRFDRPPEEPQESEEVRLLKEEIQNLKAQNQCVSEENQLLRTLAGELLLERELDERLYPSR